MFRLKFKLCFGPDYRNYTRQESKHLLAIDRCNRNALGEAMASRAEKRLEPEIAKSQLSKQDIRLLLIVCTELVNFCAKLTGKIDPAAAAMLTYVRDDIQSENGTKSEYL